MISLAVMIAGPALTVADQQVTTKLTPDTSGNPGSDPILVKAKWEMLNLVSGNPGVGEAGEDDSSDGGAQFLPPEEGWGHNLEYSVCAVVHGRDKNIANIKNVIAEIFYPSDRPMHTSDPEVTCDSSGVANENGTEIDNPSGGCGAMIEQNMLTKLSQAEGIELVCNQIKNNNPGLINAWADGEDYDTLCNSTDGQLIKGWAAVYCADKELTWEDPAGDYKVVVMAYDQDGTESKLENTFHYIETTGFEIDFDTVDYGNVKISEDKKIYGDKCYLEDSSPTIRNTGNVRLNIKVAQDDMGLGYQTGHDGDPAYWNVEYDARVGDLVDDWTNYKPFDVKGETPGSGDYTQLNGEILDLSEIEEMDFSIHVIEKWPGNLDEYTGSMWLSADQADFGQCS